MLPPPGTAERRAQPVNVETTGVILAQSSSPGAATDLAISECVTGLFGVITASSL